MLYWRYYESIASWRGDWKLARSNEGRGAKVVGPFLFDLSRGENCRANCFRNVSENQPQIRRKRALTSVNERSAIVRLTTRKGNLILTGHYASDFLGIDPLVDALEAAGVEVDCCNNMIRVKRTGSNHAQLGTAFRRP